MIRWAHVPGKLAGFTYIPLWEVGFGWFLMIMACLVPILFFWYNGVQTRQYAEWVFCLVFLVFFLFLGYNLAHQSLTATAEEGRLTVTHDLREPAFSGSWPIADWQETVHRQDGEGDRNRPWKLCLRMADKEILVYESVNQSEIATIKQAFEELKRSVP